MLLYDVLQQGLPMNVVPHGIETKGTILLAYDQDILQITIVHSGLATNS